MPTSLGGPARADTRTARIEKFLDLVAEGRDGRSAAMAAGFSWRELNLLGAKDLRFRREWANAGAMAVRLFDSVLLDHAIHGVAGKARYGSGKGEDVTEFSDALAATVGKRIDAARDAEPPPAAPPPHPVTLRTARRVIRERIAAQDAAEARLLVPAAYSGDRHDGTPRIGQAP